MSKETMLFTEMVPSETIMKFRGERPCQATILQQARNNTPHEHKYQCRTQQSFISDDKEMLGRILGRSPVEEPVTLQLVTRPFECGVYVACGGGVPKPNGILLHTCTQGGRDPGQLAEAVAGAVGDFGYRHVNLNCGCPSYTVSTEHRMGDPCPPS